MGQLKAVVDIHAWLFVEEWLKTDAYAQTQPSKEQLLFCFNKLRKTNNSYIVSLKNRISLVPEEIQISRGLDKIINLKTLGEFLHKEKDSSTLEIFCGPTSPKIQEAAHREIKEAIEGKKGRNWQRKLLNHKVSHFFKAFQEFQGCEGLRWSWSYKNETGVNPETIFPGNLDMPQALRKLYMGQPIVNLTISNKIIEDTQTIDAYIKNLLCLLIADEFKAEVLPNGQENPAVLELDQLLQDVVASDAKGLSFFAKVLRTCHASIYQDFALKLVEQVPEPRVSDSSIAMTAGSALKMGEEDRTDIRCINPYSTVTTMQRTQGLALKLYPDQRFVIATLPVKLEVVFLGNTLGKTEWEIAAQFGEKVMKHPLLF